MRQSAIINPLSCILICGLLAVCLDDSVLAQRARFNPAPPANVSAPTTRQVPVNQWRTANAPRPFIQAGGGVSAPPMTLGQPTGPFSPAGQGTVGNPNGIVVGPVFQNGPPAFDPYSGQTQVYSTIPTNPNLPPYIQTPQPNNGIVMGQPQGGFYPTYPQHGQYHPYYQNSNGGMWQSNVLSWPSNLWSRMQSAGIPKLFEHPRVRYTFLDGTDGDDIQMHDVELATTILFPNFLYTASPLRFSPGFTFHFWDGPDTAVTGVDLPPQVYSAFGAFDYQTPWDRQFGAELNFTIGVYSDFDHVNSDSLRLTGVGLGRFRMSNNVTIKAGIEYLDRLDVKLIPAGGIFIMPSPDVKLDLYFPRPRIARRIPNHGNYEVWAYMGGEYGGGSWTIQRLGGIEDQVDVNDLRVFAGFEWMGPRGVTGFFEGGYVFERELIFATMPGPIQIGDTYMLRTGFAF